jgi:hypothetical protein
MRSQMRSNASKALGKSSNQSKLINPSASSSIQAQARSSYANSMPKLRGAFKQTPEIKLVRSISQHLLTLNQGFLFKRAFEVFEAERMQTPK